MDIIDHFSESRAPDIIIQFNHATNIKNSFDCDKSRMITDGYLANDNAIVVLW